MGHAVAGGTAVRIGDPRGAQGGRFGACGALGQLVNAWNIGVIQFDLGDFRRDFRRAGKPYIRVLRRHFRHRNGTFGKRPDGVLVKLACGNRGIALANEDAKRGIDLFRPFAGFDLAQPNRNRASFATGDARIRAVRTGGTGDIKKL